MTGDPPQKVSGVSDHEHQTRRDQRDAVPVEHARWFVTPNYSPYCRAYDPKQGVTANRNGKENLAGLDMP